MKRGNTHRLIATTAAALLVEACDPGVPPRNPSDPLTDNPTAPSPANSAPAVTASTAFPPTTAGASSDRTRAAAAASELQLEETPPPALPGATPKPEAKLTFDAERACRKDADCALVPDDCTHCPPCETTWRRAANCATVNGIVKAREAVACPPIYCEQCRTLPTPGAGPPLHGYLGDAAACRDGQCVVERP